MKTMNQLEQGWFTPSFSHCYAIYSNMTDILTRKNQQKNKSNNGHKEENTKSANE